MMFTEHIPGEMDDETRLQICTLCGELLSNGNDNQIARLLHGYTPNQPVFKDNKFGVIIYMKEVFDDEDDILIVPCIKTTAKPRRK